MVAQDNAAPAPSAHAAHAPRARRGGLRRLLVSSLRLADLQYRLWLTHAKLALARMALYAALFIAAILFAALAVIFLCIGAFRILTDVLQLPLWASFLIFGAALAILALVIILIATRMLSASQTSSAAAPTSDQPRGDS